MLACGRVGGIDCGCASTATRIRIIIRFIAFTPLLFLLLERFLLILNIHDHLFLEGYLDVQTVAVTSTKKKKTSSFFLPTLPLPSPQQGMPITSSSSSSSMMIETHKSLEMITQSPLRVTSSPRFCPDRKMKILGNYKQQHHHHQLKRKEDENRIGVIPKIIHQQIPSRCVDPSFYGANLRLQNELSTMNYYYNNNTNDAGDDTTSWSIYFHTEDAMTSLFRAVVTTSSSDTNEDTMARLPAHLFPNLSHVVKHCVQNGSLLKKQLWRFLCLYVYGGIYIGDFDDGLQTLKAMNTTRSSHHDRINSNHYDGVNDAILIVSDNIDSNDNDNDSVDRFNINRNNVVINTNSIASTARHPLMYYALHHMIFKILYEDENINNNKNKYHDLVNDVLKKAFTDFQSDFDMVAGEGDDGDGDDEIADNNIGTIFSHGDDTNYFPRKKIMYHGTGNTTVTFIARTPTIMAIATPEHKGRSSTMTTANSTTKMNRSSFCLHKILSASSSSTSASSIS